MALVITYISWSLGTGYTTTGSSYTYGDSVAIQALSGTVSITSNDVSGSVTEHSPRVIIHSPTSSYSFKIYRNTPSTIIYSNNFDITETNPIYTINNQTSLVDLNASDRVFFELTRQNAEFSASALSSNSELIKVYRTNYGQAYLALTNTLTNVLTGSVSHSFIESIGSNTICFTSSLVSVYSSSIFIPNSVSTSLYSKYGDVYDNFYINPYDVLVTKNTDGFRRYNIVSSSIGPTTLCLTVSPSFVTETITNTQYILILKRNNDETNAIVNFSKSPGTTSYGFIIPNNIHPDVLDNIDKITQEVKTKLIEINAV